MRPVPEGPGDDAVGVATREDGLKPLSGQDGVKVTQKAFLGLMPGGHCLETGNLTIAI